MSSLELKKEILEKQAKLLELLTERQDGTILEEFKELEELKDRINDSCLSKFTYFSLFCDEDVEEYCPDCKNLCDWRHDGWCSNCYEVKDNPDRFISLEINDYKKKYRAFCLNTDNLMKKVEKNNLDNINDRIMDRLDELNEKINEIGEVVKYGPLSQCMLDAKSDFQKNGEALRQ